MAKKARKTSSALPTHWEPFDRSKHVYKNEAFVELVKDAIRFFNGTPVHPLPPPEKFQGTGIYAIYYTGQAAPYSNYAKLNRLAYDFPIYLGKAVPKGWRQSRAEHSEGRRALELYSRLNQHANSIKKVKGLSIEDFSCRFMIFEGPSSDMIGTLEASVIKWKKPLWNSYLDGFGNHDPGKGRYEQARSDWDVVHLGRAWAVKCKGKTPTRESLLAGIEGFLSKVGQASSQPMDPKRRLRFPMMFKLTGKEESNERLQSIAGRVGAFESNARATFATSLRLADSHRCCSAGCRAGLALLVLGYFAGYPSRAAS